MLNFLSQVISGLIFFCIRELLHFPQMVFIYSYNKIYIFSKRNFFPPFVQSSCQYLSIFLDKCCVPIRPISGDKVLNLALISHVQNESRIARILPGVRC